MQPTPAPHTLAKAVRLHEDSKRYELAGDYREAEARSRVALDLIEQEQGPASADAANVLNSLGEILRRQRKYVEAEACAHRAAIIIEPLLPQIEGTQGALILITALVLLGTTLREQGRYGESEGPLVRAIQLGRSLPMVTDVLVTALNEYGVLCEFAGWFENGEIVYRRAFELAVKQHGTHSESTAAVLHNLGGLYYASGRLEAAEEHARRGLEIRSALLGPTHRDVLGDSVAYGAILDGLGRYDESRPIYERAIREYRELYGSDSYELAAAMHNLAGVECAQGRLANAEALARRAVALKQRALGAGHPDTAFSTMNLGYILRESGRQEEARAQLECALVIFERTLAPGHPHLLRCLELLKAQ